MAGRSGRGGTRRPSRWTCGRRCPWRPPGPAGAGPPWPGAVPPRVPRPRRPRRRWLPNFRLQDRARRASGGSGGWRPGAHALNAPSGYLSSGTRELERRRGAGTGQSRVGAARGHDGRTPPRPRARHVPRPYDAAPAGRLPDGPRWQTLRLRAARPVDESVYRAERASRWHGPRIVRAPGGSRRFTGRDGLRRQCRGVRGPCRQAARPADARLREGVSRFAGRHGSRRRLPDGPHRRSPGALRRRLPAGPRHQLPAGPRRQLPRALAISCPPTPAASYPAPPPSPTRHPRRQTPQPADRQG